MTGQKGKGVAWKQSGHRKIMISLEANKGPDSEYLNNQREMLSELVEQLRDDFDDESYALLTEPKVRDKFSHIWRVCRNDPSEDIKEFWKGGLSKINMQKFKDQFSRSGLDGEDDDEVEEAEQEEEEGEGSKTDDDHDDDENAEKVVPLPSPAASHKRQHELFSEFDADVEEQPARKASRVQKTTKAQLDKEIDDGMLREDWTKARKQKEEDNKSSDHLARFLNIAAELKTSNVEQTQNIQANDLAIDMLVLGTAIKSSVEKFLKDMGFPEQQPVAIDLELFFSPEIATLFSLLVGTTGEDWNETRVLMERALATQTHAQLSLNIFLQSLLGAAIQDWVFKANTSSATTLTFLKDVVEPRFPLRAKKLAAAFDHQIGQVLPNVRRKSAITDGSAVFGLEEPKATSPVVTKQSLYYRDKTLPLTTEPRRPIITKEWQVRFLDDLVEVFGTALYIRCNLAKMYNVGWQFEFPRWMDPYDARQPSNKRVLMGLLSTIKADKEKRVNNGEEFIVSIDRSILFEGLHHPGVIE